MNNFFGVCLAEIIKQRKNYYNSWTNFISLLLWPVLVYFTTFFTYYSFDISLLKKYEISSKEDLLIFLIIGALGYNCFFAMVQGAFQILKERENGTLEMIYLTPANRLALLYGRALGGFFQSTWLFTLFFTVIIIFMGNIDIGKLVTLILSYLILFFCSIIWGGFMNALFMTSRDSSFWFSVCDEPMNFFSGVKIPVSSFPPFVRVLAAFFPLYYCLDVMRIILLAPNLQVHFMHLCNLFISVIMLVLITYFISCVSEGRNRKTGNLQLF